MRGSEQISTALRLIISCSHQPGDRTVSQCGHYPAYIAKQDIGQIFSPARNGLTNLIGLTLSLVTGGSYE